MIHCNVYQFFKDFSGLIGTIIASAVATYITYRFQKIQADIARRQADTAKRQADIANDRLRVDLFERRYKIYYNTKEIIKTVINDRRNKDFKWPDLVEYYLIIDEAIFFFPHDTCVVLKRIEELIEDFHVAVIEHESAPQDERFHEAGERAYKCERDLDEIRKSLLLLFQRDLSFPHLTKIDNM